MSTLGRAAALALAVGSAVACGPGQSAPADPQPVTSDAQSATVRPEPADAAVATTPEPMVDAGVADPVVDEPERLKMPYGAPPVRARLV